MKKNAVFSLLVIVAALGNFVDMYDLLLFTILKKESMMSLGSSDATLLTDSSAVLNAQMIGLLIGGIIWGILGDKRGRLSVLFGSITLYSIANFMNGYVRNIDEYMLCRFIAGIGLAGELGAGVTLVSESLPKEKRGYGVALVAAMGGIGALGAFFTNEIVQNWRLCYQIGGVLGIILLFLRMQVVESDMFRKLKDKHVPQGNLLMLFTNRRRTITYLYSIMIGLPIWLVTGILINQSDRFAKAMFSSSSLQSGRAAMYSYAMIAIGDFGVGYISQLLKSRKKAMLLYYGVTSFFIFLYFSPLNTGDNSMYFICGFLGLSGGAWAIVIMLCAEQFGTNLRATASTSIPNMIRGSLPLMNFFFIQIFQKTWGWGIVKSGMALSVFVIALAMTALSQLKETYGRNMNFLET